MISPKQTSWLSYFDEVNKLNINVNEHVESFFKAALPSPNRFETIHQLTKDKGNSIILYFCSSTKSIRFLHNISNIGSTTWNPDHILVALDSSSTNKASPVFIDIESIYNDISIEAPTFTRLSTISDTASLITAEAPQNNPQKFKHLPFILLPPFLWSHLLALRNKSPQNVFLETLSCIEKFIEDNKENNELQRVTKKACNNIITFLWAASKDKVPSLNLVPPGDDQAILKWSKDRHDLCIKAETEEFTLPRTIETEIVQRANEVEEILNRRTTTTESQEKKGFSKLDRSTKNLILNASAPNEEIAAGSPTEHCKNFFKQSSHGNAKLNFVRCLKHDFNAQVEVPAGVITSIYNGGFQWSKDDTPSNFSVFSFPEPQVFAKRAIQDCIILQLKEISGKGLSNEDIKDALKQGIAIPDSIESMKYSFFNMVAASKFFFGPNSCLSQKLITVFNHIVQNRYIYSSLAHQYPLFIAKFMFAVDTRVNLWLEACEEHKFRDQVDDTLIDFTDIIKDVRLRNFNYILPPSIREVVEKANNTKDTDESLELGPTSKKKRTTSPEENSRKINNSKIAKWLTNDETYNKCFRSQDILKSRPKLNGVPMCHRWHCKGYCFENCNNKASHIASNEVASCAKKAFENWIENAKNGE
jgi:hypothetical protein